MRRMPHPALTLGVIAVLVCAAAPLPVAPVETPAQIGTLVGLTPNDLVARLGPPDAIAPRSDELQVWIWGGDAERREVFVLDGSVVRAAPDAVPGSALSPPKAPYLGQRVREVVAELGPPDGVRAEPIHAGPGHQGPPVRGGGPPSGSGPIVGQATLLQYGERVFYVDAGRVVRIGVDRPTPVNGPH